MQIRLASITDLAPLSQLFDLYRQQLNQPALIIQLVMLFLNHRLVENDSMIFVCIKDDTMVGFTQLYPSFFFFVIIACLVSRRCICCA
ncbi:hypothetical protein PEC18_35420 [Paucibacter sp. O1-1]|nr:hypothetical protein [Paucibacter sp. O1-1]MDA3830957.1 hypothetical protein [Paucibacter sp. O1-1]